MYATRCDRVVVIVNEMTSLARKEEKSYDIAPEIITLDDI